MFKSVGSEQAPILDGAITLSKLVVKIALSHFDPILAITAGELLDRTVRGYAERRHEDLSEDFAYVVEEWQKHEPQLTIEDVLNHETFMPAVSKAARIAMSTPKNEKREYLRNALLNIAVGAMPDETKQQIFLNAIEALTPAHVITLKTIWTNRVVWGDQPMHRRTYYDALSLVCPEFNGQPDMVRAVLGELQNRGFSHVPNSDQLFPQGNAISNLGINFLNFILEPPPAKPG